MRKPRYLLAAARLAWGVATLALSPVMLLAAEGTELASTDPGTGVTIEKLEQGLKI